MKENKKYNKLRVCYFGTYRAEYSRNRIMIEGLRRNGVEVIECHETLWHGIEDREKVTVGGWRSLKFWVRVLRTYLRLLQHHRACNYDVMMVGYPGQLDVYIARILTWLRHKPLVWDIFMSIYLIAIERGLRERSPFTIAALRLIEKLACKLPDLLILDTAEYVAWFGKTHQIPSLRFRLVPTGADDRIFKPHPVSQESDAKFRVVYYGTFIPNHGVKQIIEAARILAKDDQIYFEMIGDGPEREQAEATCKKYGLKNITFINWMKKELLVKQVPSADVCLGAFGNTPQSLMTVQNKIYECLAMGKPVITGESSSVRNILEHGKHLYLVERSNAQALSDAIINLKEDPELRERISLNGHRYFRDKFSPTQVGIILIGHLSQLAMKLHFKDQ